MQQELTRPAIQNTSSSPKGVLPLSFLTVGNTALVESVRGNDETRRMLADMGFVPGASVAVVQRAGSNFIVEVKGTRLAVNGQTGSRILTRL